MTKPTAPRPWTADEDILYTRLFAEGKDYATIAMLMGRSEAACQKKRQKLGLKARQKCVVQKGGRLPSVKRVTEAAIAALYAGLRYRDVPPEVIERENRSPRFCQRVYRPETYLPRWA